MTSVELEREIYRILEKDKECIRMPSHEARVAIQKLLEKEVESIVKYRMSEIPNETTLAAMKEAEELKNREGISSVQEMMKKLND